jgi:hypothetical protein
MSRGNSIDHLEFFLKKLQNAEPFGLVRPGDGEYAILNDRTISTSDNWTYKAGGCLSHDLREALETVLPNFYIGISCQGCSEPIYNKMRGLLKCAPENITYANIFCNRNWRHFIDYLHGRPFVYVGPGEKDTTEFNVLHRFTIAEKLLERWDELRDALFHDLDHYIGSFSETLFCFSAGPISKILVPRYMKMFPSNTYLDVGSALDKFLKGWTNRMYLEESQQYARQVCSFEAPHHSQVSAVAAVAAVDAAVEAVAVADLTVVLNVFRRPHTLSNQIKAVKYQTCPPKKIIIWVNKADNITIPLNIREEHPDIHIIESSENVGVWGRFTAAILAQTEYVCVFDDDTIPGRRWFENCFNTMAKKEGLLGTVGLRFKPGNTYSCFPRIGWPGPNSETEQVDIVGHSWFFKRAWLRHLFQTIPTWPEYFCAGEDIAFSAGLQTAGIPTLVPPHPPGQLELYGSLPDSAWKYGMEEVGISMNAGQYNKFSICLGDCISKGFLTMANKAHANALALIRSKAAAAAAAAMSL